MKATKLHPMIISADEERVIEHRAAAARVRDAAPELLAALKAMLKEFGQPDLDPEISSHRVLIQASDAIAKAA